MELKEVDAAIHAAINQEQRKLIRTSAMFGEDQIRAIELMVGGERGPGNRKFARMMRVVIDAGLKTIQSTQGAQRSVQ